MKITKRLVMAYIAFLTSCIVSQVNATTVLGFDDIVTDGCCNPIPSMYQEFNWSSDFAVMNDSFYSSWYGNTYGSPSGENAAYNGRGNTVSVSATTDFNFVGAYFTGWANFDDYSDRSCCITATSITVTGYDDGVFVDSISMSLSANQYDWLSAGFSSVDTLVFESPVTSWWLMDNLTLTAVPVPPALILFTSGLLGLIGVSRHRKIACMHQECA